MTDNEIRREILQYAFDRKNDYAMQQVDITQFEFIKGIDQNRIRNNIIYLRDCDYVQPLNSTLFTLKITTLGIMLMEDLVGFNNRFPIRYDIPQQTRSLVDTIEDLLRGKYDVPLDRFDKAKIFLYDNNPPDFLNCIKEAVVAVEGIVKMLLNEPKGTLKDLLPKLKQTHLAHSAMAKILDGVYAVRGDEPNIAHGGIEKSDFGYDEAEFILNTCASIIIYLVRKQNNGKR